MLASKQRPETVVEGWSGSRSGSLEDRSPAGLGSVLSYREQVAVLAVVHEAQAVSELKRTAQAAWALAR